MHYINVVAIHCLLFAYLVSRFYSEQFCNKFTANSFHRRITSKHLLYKKIPLGKLFNYSDTIMVKEIMTLPISRLFWSSYSNFFNTFIFTTNTILIILTGPVLNSFKLDSLFSLI